MSLHRRELIRFLSVSVVAAATMACWAGIAMAAGLWECNWCHQQYQGNQPPAFAKCPAKEMKQDHWWIKKS